ncbi:phosphatase PAP2 family protein [bacterium BMS3Abin03]|nr:phosphatase PAP2 family protein [bacterium BMS3Abin03]
MKRKITKVLILLSIFSFTSTFYSQDSAGYDPLFNSRSRITNKEPYNTDIRLFRCINNNRTGFLNTSLTVTDYSVFPLAVILPVSMFAYGRTKDRTYDENTGVLIALSEAGSVALTTGLKFLIKRPRPYITLSNVHVKKGILSDPYSFPSGHTSTAFSIATGLALRYPKYPQVYVPAYIWGLIVGYGRIYFGMHYPIDVLGGAVVGTLSAIGIYSLRTEIFKFKNRVLGEENKPDVNKYNAKSIGIISSSFILTLGLNQFLLKSFSKLNLDFEPFTPSGNDGINCYVKYSF